MRHEERTYKFTRYGYEDSCHVVCAHFDNAYELADWYRATKNESIVYHQWDKIYKTEINEALTSMTAGKSEYNELIKNIFDKAWENMPILGNELRLSVHGSAPNVPVYLSNSPKNMYKRVKRKMNTTPVHIYFGVSSDNSTIVQNGKIQEWLIGANKLAVRGATMAAFASALAKYRPVYLTPYVLLASNNYKEAAVGSWDINTSPIVLSEIGGNLANVNVVRYLGLNISDKLNKYTTSTMMVGHNNEVQMRDLLRCKPEDIWFGSLDMNTALMEDPIAEIKRYISKYLEDDENYEN